MKLEKKVHAINEINRIAELNYNHVIPQLKEFVGKQIILKSGKKSAKFIDAITFIREEPKKYNNEYAILHNVYLDITNYSITIKISCSFKNNENSCFYQDASVYLGTMENGVLKALDSEAPKYIVYDADGVRALLTAKKQVENQLSELKSKLYLFDGYYD